jgi:hypothetical protein
MTVAPPLTEAAFLAQVIDVAHVLGWRVAHFRPCQTGRGWRTAVQGDGKGFPDLVLVRRERLIFAELKAHRGGLTDEQRIWLDELTRCEGFDTYVWWPADFDDIVETLR